MVFAYQAYGESQQSYAGECFTCPHINHVVMIIGRPLGDECELDVSINSRTEAETHSDKQLAFRWMNPRNYHIVRMVDGSIRVFEYSVYRDTRLPAVSERDVLRLGNLCVWCVVHSLR